MGSHRAHVVLPEELVKQIDALVGPRGRNAFLVETAQAEVRKRRLLAFLADPEPAWKDEDHPELAEGSDVWVRKMRQGRDPWKQEREREEEEQRGSSEAAS